MIPPQARYESLLSSGILQGDPAQATVVAALQSLYQMMEVTPSAKNSWPAFLKKQAPAPQGIYIYGGVGRGKSMLMDLFYDCITLWPKRRVHFHSFMLSLHQFLHTARKGPAAKVDDALLKFARAVAHEARLLCFDEFHVSDVADAMLLGRLFQALWGQGVVIIVTSNWAPDDLYKDGLQRDRFLPFIAALKKHLRVLHLDSPVDYRLGRLQGSPVYYAPLGPHAQREMEKLFHDLTGDAAVQPLELQMPGRRWIIPRAAKGIVWLDFDTACGQARAAADYLALTAEVQVIFLTDVPLLSDELRNETKRFMTLIDILYEGRIKLVMAAQAAPNKLYPQGQYAFEFQRTASRLLEMQSKAYLGDES